MTTLQSWPATTVSTFKTADVKPYPFTLHLDGTQFGHKLVMGPISQGMSSHILDLAKRALTEGRE